jgi:ribonuclease P protein component
MRRRQRLRSAADFQRVRSRGRSYAHPLLVVYVHPNDEAVTRFGFTLSKRVGKAVARNRAKRLLREAARKTAPALPAGLDIVVVGRPPLASASAAEVAEALTVALRQADVLRT